MAAKKVLRLLSVGVIVLLLATTLSGCDQIMSLLGIEGPGGPGGPGGPSMDPIDIPASVDQDPDYITYENDFHTAVNDERTAETVPTFPTRDSNLDALARRYAKAGACDVVPENLRDRVAIEIGTCSDAAFFLGESNSLTDYVNTHMTAWLAGPSGPTTIQNAGFNTIGIGMAEITDRPGGAPGETWHSVVILFAKP